MATITENQRRSKLFYVGMLAVTLSSHPVISRAVEPLTTPATKPVTPVATPAVTPKATVPGVAKPATPAVMPTPAKPTVPATAAPTSPAVPVVPVTPPPPVIPANPISQSIASHFASIKRQKEAVEEIYRLTNYQFIWANNPNTEAALKLFEDAPSKGLDIEYYDVDALRASLKQLKVGTPSTEQLAAFDTALTNNLLSYLSDLGYGRVNPQKVRFDFQVNKEPLKLAQALLTASKDGSFKALADKTEPTLVFYRYMREAFSQYHAAEQVRKEVKFTRVGLSKEHPTEQVAQLRKLLIALGDIEASKTADDSNSAAYDEALIQGIKSFQKRHGLASKSLLNKATINALNAPVTGKLEQMKLSLERLRWIPRFEEDRMVLVNIPSFQLWAFDSLKDEDAEPLTMRVVVGKAAGKQTPSFSSKMQYVEFRPTWSVPQSIIKHEFGNLLRNPGALARRNMKVSYHNGVVSVRQASGDHNALGLVKFLFPNNHSVYFHDTPSKHFFKQSRRDFSHGCVRLANPDLFAQFALNKQTDEWTMDKINRSMHKGGQKRITLEAPVPVVIFYGTALAVDHTGVHFYADVYGHDAKLKAALEQTKKAASKKEKPQPAEV